MEVSTYWSIFLWGIFPESYHLQSGGLNVLEAGAEDQPEDTAGAVPARRTDILLVSLSVITGGVLYLSF